MCDPVCQSDASIHNTANVPGTLETVTRSEMDGSGSADLDLWIAIAAGEPVWSDPEEAVHPVARATAAVELLALAAGVSLVWTVFLLTDPSGRFASFAPWLGSAALLGMAIRPFRLLIGQRRAARLWPSVGVRTVVLIVAITSLISDSPLWGLLSIWPLAVAMGAEAALSCWEIGTEIAPIRWWLLFLRSPLHLGIVGACAAVVINAGAVSALSVALPAYLLLHLCVLVGALVAGAADRVRIGFEYRVNKSAANASAAAHRQSAHWLHDDVSAELKLVQLKLRRSSLGRDQIADELQALDHQLRLRQLDELFRSGNVRVAEILQPFVRNAQSHGIVIATVPTFDDARVILDERVGRLFGRAVAIVTNNAIVAGATELAYAVTSDSETVQLAVTDNAGGFEISDAPVGRGLWQLGKELGTSEIRTDPCGDGTTVTVVIALSVRTTGGSNTDR